MKQSLLLFTALAAAFAAQADVVAHFNMTLDNGCITESVSGQKFPVEGNFAPENVDAPCGKALRFDGYTSHVNASIDPVIPAGAKAMSVALRVALPCYPIIEIDKNTSEQTPIVTCLDSQSKSGWGFYIGFDGRYSFRCFINGWPATIEVSEPLPVYQWNYLLAAIDCDARSIKLYNNGREVASGKANGSLSASSQAMPLYFGQSTESRMSGPFQLMSFNGLIDDLTLYNSAVDASIINDFDSEVTPDLDIPSSRFADDLLRPRFHGMPAAGWTNECHGMTFADGRYHLFFQKNGDGPYMARLHWGHISSENLYDWREEPIAIAPGDPYDIKGCWSGCVFSDDEITGGKPNIIYTAVDYAKASIAQAFPLDPSLNSWDKSASNPIIAARPSGLGDDFRDPYFFRSDNNAYIIVGSSKNGIGTTTLHRYNPSSGSWTNTGELFFSGSSAYTDGTFWEMPNITPMSDSKWLFTATPLGTSQGVRTLYWTGTINPDGTFAPDANSSTPRLIELNSKEGFGLLSPTIFQYQGKTIALGIVPDKLPAQRNWQLGWAHCYSLPRQWSIDANGNLSQQPLDLLTGLRTSTTFLRHNFSVNGTENLAPVSGRAFEILATATVGTSKFGFNFFKNGSAQASVTYDPATARLTFDFTHLPRWVNDEGVYDGIYTLSLPQRPATGSNLKINLFVDHSIIDVFVNDSWATSIRVFPTDSEANSVELFSDGEVTFSQLQAWTLSPDADGGFQSITDDFTTPSIPSPIYDLYGRQVADSLSELDNPSPGIYLSQGRKFIHR